MSSKKGVGRPRNPHSSTSCTFRIYDELKLELDRCPNKTQEVNAALENNFRLKEKSNKWIHEEIKVHQDTIYNLNSLLSKRKEIQTEKEKKIELAKKQKEIDFEKFVERVLRQSSHITKKYINYLNSQYGLTLSEEEFAHVKSQIEDGKFTVDDFKQLNNGCVENDIIS